MSVATKAHPKRRGGTVARLWIGFIVVIVAAIALAWLGAGSLRPQVTSSGLQFRTIAPGTGPTMVRSDAALIDYVLTSSNGTVFDSSETHGGPQPMTMDQVFPGFAEAMTRMQADGQYRFTMPESLAFGANPPPPSWPKGSPLTFDVRVRKIVPNGAAMLQQQQMQQMQQQQMQQGAPQQ